METGTKLSKIRKLKDYFKKKPSVLMVFVFGSQAKNLERKISDWDIGVYFKPKEYLELETEIEEYPGEKGMWGDLVDILKTNNVDLVILNRARPDLVYTVLKDGIPLVIRDEGLYFDLLCKTNYEAIDWWNFVFEFWKIGKKTEFLTLNGRKSKILSKQQKRYIQNSLKRLAK